MAKLADLTAKDICELRLQCVAVYVQTASKLDITKELVLVYGENLFQHCIKGLSDIQKKTP